MDRRSYRCLSPLEWKAGWAKGFAIVPVVVIVVGAFKWLLPFFDTSMPIAIGLAALAVAFTIAFLCPSRIDLEEDGIVIRRYGRSRRVAWSAIDAVETIQRLGTRSGSRSAQPGPWTVYTAVRFTLTGGSVIDVGTSTEETDLSAGSGPRVLVTGAVGSYGAFDRKAWEIVQAVTKKLREDAEPIPADALPLMRGEKTVTEWLASLAKPAAPDIAYRVAEEPPDRYWEILEDEHAPREARAGAAFALRGRIDREENLRMRAVAASCASPKLRIAIETALDEDADDARVHDVLEKVSTRAD